WRDRLVASKQGVQANENDGTHRPISVVTYDNLNEQTEVRQYDGDGLTDNITDSLPQGKLRALTINSYDNVGRLYRTQVFGVDPSSGTPTTAALTTNVFF